METKIPQANPVSGLTVQEELLLPLPAIHLSKRIRKRIKYIRPAVSGVYVNGAILSEGEK